MSSTTITATVKSKLSSGCVARVMYRSTDSEEVVASPALYVPGGVTSTLSFVLEDADLEVPYSVQVRAGAGDEGSAMQLLNSTHAFTTENKLSVTVGGVSAWDVMYAVSYALVLILFIVIIVLAVRRSSSSSSSSAQVAHAKKGGLRKSRASAYPAVFQE